MKSKKTLLSCFCWWGSVASLWAQASTNAPLDDINHYLIDRMQIEGSDFRHLHSNIKPFTQRAAMRFIVPEGSDTMATILLYIPDNEYIKSDNGLGVPPVRAGKSFFRHFYRSQPNLYEYHSDALSFKLNPMFNFQAGGQRLGDSTQFLYTNMRGVQVRGDIAKKVFFYTDIQENQMVMPQYMADFVTTYNAIPNAGFYKPFASRFAPNQNAGVDYLLASGYISTNVTPYINLQFGNGRNFVGDGVRSLLLSNFSNNYTYFKINTHYKFFHYQNLYAELVGNHLPVANIRVPRKYMTAHYLSVNILKNLNIGIFESVIFGDRGGYEWSYLNPVIFYRAAEQGLGSPDNVNIGLTAKWNFWRRFSVYGQLLFDEFVFNELFVNRNGWWGNKYGIQLGAKYVNAFGIKNLDLQLEYNMVRPYTYTFKDSSANYTHYNQPLAHPLGANFREFLAVANYRFLNRFWITAQAMYYTQGRDTMGTNWGYNVHLPYVTRQQEYGNTLAQGVRNQVFMGNLQVQYQLFHNLFATAQYTYRRQSDAIGNQSTAHIGTLGLRYNFFPINYNF